MIAMQSSAITPALLDHPGARAASHLLVSSVRVQAGEKAVLFVIDGCRFREDGLPGKRRESIYLHFGAAES